jgi:hypothetical protein
MSKAKVLFLCTGNSLQDYPPPNMFTLILGIELQGMPLLVIFSYNNTVRDYSVVTL